MVDQKAYVVIDSFAWFEYFLGSSAGEVARSYVDEGRTLTPTIVIAELSEKYGRLGLDFKEKLKFMKLRSQLIPLDEDIAELAGKLSLERKKRVEHWGMADSIVLATARLGNQKIITGDEHFRDLKEAMMIK